MTKFEQMRRSADMMERACTAIMDAAYDAVRWDDKYLKQSENEYNKFDDEELYAHLNEEGLKVIQLAHDLIAKLENAF